MTPLQWVAILLLGVAWPVAGLVGAWQWWRRRHDAAALAQRRAEMIENDTQRDHDAQRASDLADTDRARGSWSRVEYRT